MVVWGNFPVLSFVSDKSIFYATLDRLTFSQLPTNYQGWSKRNELIEPKSHSYQKLIALRSPTENPTYLSPLIRAKLYTPEFGSNNQPVMKFVIRLQTVEDQSDSDKAIGYKTIRHRSYVVDPADVRLSLAARGKSNKKARDDRLWGGGFNLRVQNTKYEQEKPFPKCHENQSPKPRE